jgi:hypothetical protein
MASPDGPDVTGTGVLGEPVYGSLGKVARDGDELATLRELRDNLADAIDNARTRGLYAEVSSLTGRFTTVIARISQLAPDTGKGTALDEVTKRREAREATGPSGSAQRRQRR